MTNESAAAASSSSASGKATLKSGVRVIDVEAGKKVSELRAEWAQLFRIPTDAKAFSGTQELPEDAEVAPGQTVEFIKKSGEKG